MVGLYFLMRGIINTFYWIIYYRALLSYGSSYGTLTPDNLANIAPSGMELVFGLLVHILVGKPFQSVWTASYQGAKTDAIRSSIAGK